MLSLYWVIHNLDICERFASYDRIGAPRFPASKSFGDHGRDGSRKVFPKALFEGLPLVFGQSVDKRHDFSFLAGSVRLASLRCLYLVIQALAFGLPLVCNRPLTAALCGGAS